MSTEKSKKLKSENNDFLETRAFNLGVSLELDIQSALVFSHIQYWTNHNKMKNKNLNCGKYWTCQTTKEISLYIKCLNERQINYAIDKLEKAEYILSKIINWSGNTWDRTKSYTVNDEILQKASYKIDQSILQNCQMEETNLQDDNSQNCQMNIKDSKNIVNKDSKKDSKEKTDFSCYDLLSSYYAYLKEKGFSLSENFVDRSYVNNFQNDSAYSNMQLAKNKSKYLLMFEDAKDLFDKLLYIEETVKKHPQVKQDAIYLNLPKTYYLGSVLKGRLSILNVFGKCQEIALKPTTLRGSFYDGVNVYDSPENPHHVVSGVLGDSEDDIF